MINIFNEIFYYPLFNALVFLYEYLSFGDLGIAIIALTVLIRIILLPLFYKGAKDQAIIGRLAPKIKEIQKNHKDDLGKQGQAMMELYREHKVNPLSSVFLLFAQLPILFALYMVFSKGITAETLKNLYSFIAQPAVLDNYFLGVVDLSERSLFIVILAALAQFFQGKMLLAKTTNGKDSAQMTQMEKMSRQMVFIGPIMTLLFFSALPSAIGLYWLTTSIFSVIQQIIINKRLAVSDEKLIEIDKKLHHKL